MTSNKCGWNSFPEPLTGGLTCTKCIYICDPLYETPKLCEQYCPEYLKRIGTSTLQPAKPSASYTEKQVEKELQITPTVCFITVAVLCGLISVLICVGVWLLRKKWKWWAEKRNEPLRNIEENSLITQTTAVMNSSGDSTTQNHPSDGSSSGNDSSGTSTSGIGSSQSSTSAGNTASKSDPSTAQRSAERRSSGSCSVNRCGGGSNSADRCSIRSILVDGRAGTSRTRSNNRSVTLIVPSISLRSSLSLCSEPLLQRSVSGEQTSSTSCWQDVLDVYDAINCNLHELTWIIGCMLEKNRINIIVDHRSTDAMSQWQHEIRNIVPETISSEIFHLTFALPSLKTRCGNFGTGCIVMNEKRKIARVTIQGSRVHESGNETDVFIFTVAHLLKEGESCQLFCNCSPKIVHERQAQCLCHVDTVKDEFVYDIKHKLYDLSLIHMQGVPFTGNRFQFTYKGRRLFLDIDIRRVDMDPHSIRPGMKVLIFGDHSNQPITGCISDEAIFTCCCDKSAMKQVINFIQIQSTDENRSLDFDGISGSLIVRYPDDDFADAGDISVEAFALIIGTNSKRPDRAIALPLWDQMLKLFQENKSLADLEKYITFQVYHPCHAYDSGISVQREGSALY